MKPTDTAVFDEKLFLWVDGKSRDGKPFGVWNYYDLDKELILQRKFNMQGKMFKEEHFGSKGIDKGAIFASRFYFSFRLEAPKNKEGYEHGIYKEWFRYEGEEPLERKKFKGKSLEEIYEIWKKSVWILNREIYYDDGYRVWIKNYDKKGNVESIERFDEEEDEVSEEELLSFAVSTKGKSMVENYEEYLQLCEYCMKKEPIVNKKASNEDVSALEKRLHVSLPDELKVLYTTYANGVNLNYGFVFFSTNEVVGIVDFFKTYYWSSDYDGFVGTHFYNCQNNTFELLDEKQKQEIQELNESYFVFAYEQINADFIVFIFTKKHEFTTIWHVNEESIILSDYYASKLQKNYRFKKLEPLWNGFLDILKRDIYYNQILETYEFDEKYVETDEEKWKLTLGEKK